MLPPDPLVGWRGVSNPLNPYQLPIPVEAFGILFPLAPAQHDHFND